MRDVICVRFCLFKVRFCSLRVRFQMQKDVTVKCRIVRDSFVSFFNVDSSREI
jgi:hypothetical protein